MAKKSLVTKLKIGEVSFCGKGMNPEANITLFKSDFTKEDMEKAARMFSDVLGDMEMAEQVRAIIDQLMTYNRAFQTSVVGMIHDEEVKDKKEAIRQSLQQYINVLNAMATGDTFNKAADGFEALISGNPEQDPAELIKQMETLTKEETMSKELEAKLKKAEDDAKAVQKKLEKAEAAAERAGKIAELSDVQKKYFNGLDDKGKDDFLAKSAEERDAVIQKAAEADEVLTVDGNTIKKSEVGPGVFAFMKAQQTKLAKTEADLKKTEEANLAKAQQEAGEKAFPHLPGEPVVKGHLMKAVNSLPEDQQRGVLEMLKAGDVAMAKGFDENGHGSDVTPSDAEEKLNKMAEEYAKKENVSFHKAYDAVLKTTEGGKLYEETLSKK